MSREKTLDNKVKELVQKIAIDEKEKREQK